MPKQKTKAELMDLITEIAERGEEIEDHLCNDGRKLLDKIRAIAGVNRTIPQLVIQLRGHDVEVPPEFDVHGDWRGFEIAVTYKGKALEMDLDDVYED